jgi:hypothetical protein
MADEYKKHLRDKIHQIDGAYYNGEIAAIKAILACRES